MRGSCSLPDADILFHLLTRELNLFRIREGTAGPTVSLMHQRFRDCLAAIHLLNLAQTLSEEDGLPEAWKQPIDYYVMNFVAELLRPGDTTAAALWNANRRLRPSIQAASFNLLELYKRSRDFDFSELNFSHLDLREVHLHGYRRPSETHLRLPTDGRKLHRTILSPETFAPEGHAVSISQIVVTPDSQRFVTASFDNTLRVWDVNTCRTLWVLDGHTSWVTDVALTMDGRKCVSAAEDYTLRIWELDTGICTGILKGHTDHVIAVAMCTDGHTCASASKDGTVRLWNMDSGREAKKIQVFKDGRISRIIKVQTANSSCFAFATMENVIRIWNVATHHLSPELKGKIDGTIDVNAISPNGRRFVVSTKSGLWIWDTNSGECIGKCPSIFTALTITADGNKIIGGCNNHTLQIRSITNPMQCSMKIPLSGTARQIIVMPDENRCMVTSETITQILNLCTGDVEGEFSSLSGRVIITPDSRRCICGICALEIWNLETCTRMCGADKSGSFISAAAITPDGQWCISASSDGLVRLWDIGRGRLIRFLETPVRYIMKALAITPDGRKCIGISDRGTTQTWDIKTGALMESRELGNLWLFSASITPDGRWCVGCTPNWETPDQILLWDLTLWNPPRKLPPRYFFCTAMALTADGNHLILVDNREKIGVVHKIDLQSGKETPLHWKPQNGKIRRDGQINSIAATPDGNCIILGTYGNIAIWHEGDSEAHMIPASRGKMINVVAVTPDGRRCISASRSTLRIWDTDTGECLSTIKPLDNIDLLGVDLSQAVCSPEDYAKILYQNGALIVGGKPENCDS